MTDLRTAPRIDFEGDLLASGDIAIEEGHYLARLIQPADPLEVHRYQQLRYDYFVRQKGWVQDAPHDAALEADRYDADAWHLAVFDGGPQGTSDGAGLFLAAYLRALPWTAPCGFMLDADFRCLLDSQEVAALHQPGTVELSRLVIAPRTCTNGGSAKLPQERGVRLGEFHIMEVLLKLLYQLSRREGVERFCIVVEEPWLKSFARRFHLPFQPIGRPHTFPDGTRTRAALTTRMALEQSMALRDPLKYRWYQQMDMAETE